MVVVDSSTIKGTKLAYIYYKKPKHTVQGVT